MWWRYQFQLLKQDRREWPSMISLLLGVWTTETEFDVCWTIRWLLPTGFDEEYAWTLLMLLRQRTTLYMTKSIWERLPFGDLFVQSLFTCFWKDMFPKIKLCSPIKLTRWCLFRFVLPWKEKPWAIWAFISPPRSNIALTLHVEDIFHSITEFCIEL